MKKQMMASAIFSMLLFAACSKDDDMEETTKMYPVNNPASASIVEVDRFSAEAGVLMVRTSSNGLPAANEPINFDAGEPFITMGLAPDGSMVEYYNFDVQSTEAAPIYVLFKEGEDTPVEGQLNIINVIPGDNGYNDFWHVQKVTVPMNYEANSASSLTDIMERGFEMTATDIIVNCPVVPDGSTATKRLGGGSNALTSGWYKGEVVKYFNFTEKDLMNEQGMVPLSPIYVAFNVNPDENDPNSGPASGFVTEMNSAQTHNVIATIPSNAAYSPLWSVNVYDNADFTSVMDLSSAMSANILANGVATVNCPVVEVN